MNAKQYLSRNTVYYRPYISALTELLSTQNEVVLDKDEKNYRFYFDAMADYRQSFCASGCRDFSSLGFWSGSNKLTVGNNDGRADIDGYNLGLGYNFNVDADGVAGKLTLNNGVRQTGANLKLYYEHNKKGSGFYMKLEAPIISLSVNSNLNEDPVATPDTATFLTQTTSNPASSVINYANAEYLTPYQYSPSAAEFFIGGVDSCTTMNGNINKIFRLNRGFIAVHNEFTRIADLTAAVGYNLVTQNENRFSVGFKFSAPTGNVPQGFSMAEPIAGRAGCWALGGETYGHVKVWGSANNNSALYINMQGECYHWLANRRPSMRTFDLLKNGLGSKYLVVQRYTPFYVEDYNGNPAHSLQYIPGQLFSAAHITTLPIRSQISIEGSFATQIKYVHDNKWAVSLTGELFGRAQEKIKIDHVSVIDFKYETLNNYAVVGRQIGLYSINNSTNTAAQTLFASLCEPNATINKSQDPIQLVGSVATVTVPAVLPEGIADARDSKNRIPAEFDQALDICGAQVPSVLSGTVFLSVDRIWEHVSLLPTLSVFGGVEINNNNSLPQMWVVGIKGNIQF
jgi:hypothetical protein